MVKKKKDNVEKKSQEYDFKKIEEKWQKKWEKEKVFEVSKNSKKDKNFILEMLPYPSASDLHMGHALNYFIGDVFARFKRMNGFNVLYPMGFDALGLPAENAAIKAGEHPKPFTEKAMKNCTRQMKEMGLSYDWSKTLSTMNPEYYKWNQYFFLKFLEKGLIYRKKASVNWCPKCNTVLANEQVQGGKCWRHEDTEIEIKHLDQWYLKTTEYAEELLEKLEGLEWPDRIKAMQRNWIGKSHGTEIEFEVEKANKEKEKWPIFTTRPDTIFGVTFMVISAQHSRLRELVTDNKKKDVDKFLKKVKTVSQKSMKEVEELEKEGVFTGSYATNPVNGEKVPIYAGNFVVAEYGSGMVMAVPAHDQRDFEFAKKFKIPIKIVIQPELKEIDPKKMVRAFTDEGKIVNSGEFSGVSSGDGKDMIADWLEEKSYGKKTVEYKLRDWGFSRQRYWGTPIPIIKCESCGLVPVPEKDLPVELPEKVDFGEGNPLETNEEWLNVKCPKCKKDAKREPDTMDTFFDSSWYFLRYCDNKNNKKPFNKEKVNYWMPVDQYVGGAEHACMHLIYSRFFTKALRDCGFLNFDEPFRRLFNQGMLNGPDGKKMSKSKGNVINPDEVSERYGMDTARFFMLSLASPDKDRDWSKKGVEGSLKFLNKIIRYFKEGKIKKSSLRTEHKINSAIKNVSSYIENFKYNLATIELRELFEYISKEKEISKKDLGSFVKLLSPFCPHVAEELWENLGNKGFVSLEKWPEVDESKIDEKLEKQEKQIEKVSEDIKNILSILESRGEKNKKVVKIYAIPNEIELYKGNINAIQESVPLKVEIFSVKDAKKSGKQVKAKPGKPGILIE